MTSVQISTITTMRGLGASYTNIANVLGLSKDTVKKYCQRHDLQLNNPDTKKNTFCQTCGKPLTFIPGKKSKRFCDDHCRYTWHNKHRAYGGSNVSL